MASQTDKPKTATAEPEVDPVEAAAKAEAERPDPAIAPPEAAGGRYDSLIPRDRLIAEARTFVGYEPYEVAGALTGVKGEGPGKDLFDVATVKTTVKDWLKKPEEAA